MPLTDGERAAQVTRRRGLLEVLRPDMLAQWSGRHSHPPETLYHYTSAQGLLGILGGELFATHTAYLNDPQEIAFAERIIREFLRARRSAFEAHQVVARFYDRLIEAIDVVRTSRELFVASLSANGDLLSQWQAYADRGKGYAVGFDGPSLRDVYGSPDIIYLRRVIYERVEQDQALNQLAKSVENIFTKIKLESPENESQLILEMIFVVGETLEEFLVTFKHKAFMAEEEWRICLSRSDDPVRSSPMPVPDVRVDNGKLVPYMPIPLSQETRRNPIRRLTLGPSLGDNDRRALSLLIQKRNLTDVVISQSEILLR